MSENLVMRDGNMPAARRVTRAARKSVAARRDALDEWKKKKATQKRQSTAPVVRKTAPMSVKSDRRSRSQSIVPRTGKRLSTTTPSATRKRKSTVARPPSREDQIAALTAENEKLYAQLALQQEHINRLATPSTPPSTQRSPAHTPTAYVEEVRALRLSLERRTKTTVRAEESIVGLREASAVLMKENTRLSQALEEQKMEQLKQLHEHIASLYTSDSQASALRDSIAVLNAKMASVNEQRDNDLTLISSLRDCLQQMVDDSVIFEERERDALRRIDTLESGVVELDLLRSCEKENPPKRRKTANQGTQFTAVDVQVQAIKIREQSDEITALRFANEVVIQEMAAQKREISQLLADAREQQAEEEEIKWRGEFEGQIFDLQKQMEVVLGESVHRIAELEAELAKTKKGTLADRIRSFKHE